MQTISFEIREKFVRELKDYVKELSEHGTTKEYNLNIPSILSKYQAKGKEDLIKQGVGKVRANTVSRNVFNMILESELKEV